MISPGLKFFECVAAPSTGFAEPSTAGGSLDCCAGGEVVGEFFTGGGDCGAFGLFSLVADFSRCSSSCRR